LSGVTSKAGIEKERAAQEWRHLRVSDLYMNRWFIPTLAGTPKPVKEFHKVEFAYRACQAYKHEALRLTGLARMVLVLFFDF